MAGHFDFLALTLAEAPVQAAPGAQPPPAFQREVTYPQARGALLQ